MWDNRLDGTGRSRRTRENIMDQELKGLLKDLSTIEESLPTWDFASIEKQFQALHPNYRIAYFHDREDRDDNVFLRIWDDADIDYMVYIYTNDDSIYYSLPNMELICYDSEL